MLYGKIVLTLGKFGGVEELLDDSFLLLNFTFVEVNDFYQLYRNLRLSVFYIKKNV